MELEKQVCSIELAKQLHALAVQQEAYWYWVPNVRTDKPFFNWESVGTERYPAFTVAELGQMLPRGITSCKAHETFHVHYDGTPWLEHWNKAGLSLNEVDLWALSRSTTEADARAKMLAYLLENKLVTL